MNSFRVEVTDGPLDLNRIGRSGQMFRWVPNKDGWAVYEGDRLHLVQQADSVLNVTSTHDEDDFRKLLRLDENHEHSIDSVHSFVGILGNISVQQVIIKCESRLHRVQTQVFKFQIHVAL